MTIENRDSSHAAAAARAPAGQECGADMVLAHGALQGGAEGAAKLQDHLTPVVEAWLADVVQTLRGSWISGPAQHWGSIHAIGPLAVSRLDQRVSTALRQSFLGFSQLLCSFEQLLLESQQLGVVSEQRLLGIEQKAVHLGHFGADQTVVAGGKCGGADVLGCLDGRHGGGNE